MQQRHSKLTQHLRQRFRAWLIVGITSFGVLGFPPLANSQSGPLEPSRCFYEDLCFLPDKSLTLSWLAENKGGPKVLVRTINDEPVYVVTAQTISMHKVTNQVLWFDLLQTLKRSRRLDSVRQVHSGRVLTTPLGSLEGRSLEFVKGYDAEPVSYFLLQKSSGDYWVIATAAGSALLADYFSEIEKLALSAIEQ
ncbi:hypothetical protein QWI17_10350 [Gilvimarinus sp. SDUM040013]|uniref:Uncharacterized protein n=1 Tax=Gilvimarinus gilvus TaxID=3058038 RepID=A0ABU4RZW4_9GAMM|nr:hypothetical protein [Gilvimarinus sp. SDUM040013]MDO3386238.1 hypothetical protein [Gilvimarinus sp. SDUM040013]MDX6849767.1 hypothetical protein [Gilvimarinus sp. SDUM040013]